MKKYTISQAAKLCGVHVDTLRKWERWGRISPNYTLGGHRRYDQAQLADIEFRNDNVALLSIQFDTWRTLPPKLEISGTLTAKGKKREIKALYEKVDAMPPELGGFIRRLVYLRDEDRKSKIVLANPGRCTEYTLQDDCLILDSEEVWSPLKFCRRNLKVMLPDIILGEESSPDEPIIRPVCYLRQGIVRRTKLS